MANASSPPFAKPEGNWNRIPVIYMPVVRSSVRRCGFHDNKRTHHNDKRITGRESSVHIAEDTHHKRPKRNVSNPSASGGDSGCTHPMAEVISLRLANFCDAKWFAVHPALDISTVMSFKNSTLRRQRRRTSSSRQTLTSSFLMGAWFLKLRKMLYIGTHKNAMQHLVYQSSSTPYSIEDQSYPSNSKESVDTRVQWRYACIHTQSPTHSPPSCR